MYYVLYGINFKVLIIILQKSPAMIYHLPTKKIVLYSMV